MFLIESDYYHLIQSEVLDVVVDNNPEFRIDAELSAKVELESYLNERYDTVELFKEHAVWSFTSSYSTGDFVVLQPSDFILSTIYNVNDVVAYQGMAYICILVTTGVEVPTNATYFAPIGLVDTFYTCILDTTASTDLINDPTYWTEGDTRNALIRRYMIDVSLYELHSRINPRNIPEWRVQRRDDAISYMKSVADPRSNITPNFPTVDPDDDPDDNKTVGYDISYGGNSQQANGQNSY